jgi:hypothetical protein
VEQWWHPASPEAERCLTLEGEPERVEAWRSRTFAERQSLTALCVRKHGELPMTIAAKIRLD